MLYGDVSIFLSLLLTIFCLHFSAAAPDCSRVENVLEASRSSSANDSRFVQSLPSPVCSNEQDSCCDLTMEHQLYTKQFVKFDKIVKRHNEEIRSAFNKMHKKFDNYFLQLIDSAAASLDDLFYQTYGDIYSNNSRLFADLFRDMKDYYRGSSLEIQDQFESFFTRVLQRVFQLLHPKRLFTEDYQQCIADNVYIIQPFALIPETISSQVQRSFANARNFVRGLEVGARLEGGRISEHQSCSTALTKMSTCPLCRGHLSTKPCFGLCVKVMNGCLVENHRLHRGWKDYIDALRSLVYRLEGPYNIEAVLDPIDVKISEAIMMLQENKADITAAIFKFCGTPQMNPNLTSQSINEDMNFPTDLMNYNDLTNVRNFHTSSEFKLPKLRHLPSDGDTDPDTTREKRSFRSKTRAARKRKRISSKRRERQSRRGRTKKKIKHIKIVDESRFSGESPVNEPSINVHLTEFKVVMDDYEQHWMSLTKQICRKEAENSDNCWNGKEVGKYRKQAVGDEIKQQKNNLEIEVNDHVISLTVRQQLLGLKRAAEHLRGTYEGEDAYMGLDDVDGIYYSGMDSTEEPVLNDYDMPPDDDVNTTNSITTTSMTTISLNSTTPTAKCDGCGNAVSPKSSVALVFILFLFTTLSICSPTK